jgi:hypothetical protein
LGLTESVDLVDYLAVAELKNPGTIEFTGVIKEAQMRNNLAHWIDFPYDLKEIYGKGNLVPVKVTFDGRVHYQGSLAKMGGEHAMILLRNDVYAELNKKPGDKVKIKVELDTNKRKIELAKDEKEALKKAGLLDKFTKMAFTHQREYHQWIEEAKKPETRARRIEQMIERISSLLTY